MHRRCFSSVRFPQKVRIWEVGARDGLQNVKKYVSLEDKVTLIRMLEEAGLRHIEAGSFVSPKWVPQMADSEKVFRQLALRPNPQEGTIFGGLTPNMKGLEAALSVGATEVGVFAAASETFSLKNINCSVNESIARFEPVCKAALDAGVRLRAGVSCVLGCPFEGKIDPQKVLDVVQQLLALGCYEVSLADTIGAGTSGSTQRLLDCILRDIPAHKLAVHFHDTYGQALANIYTSLRYGISTVDSAVSGLGGCPFAPGATGNVATEDVVYMLQGLGIDCGVDLDKLVDASMFVDAALGQETASKVGRAWRAKRIASQASQQASNK